MDLLGHCFENRITEFVGDTDTVSVSAKKKLDSNAFNV